MSYEIVIGYNIYPANLIDNGAKIDWSKGDNGLIFEKKLDGKFVMFRAGNETVYDAIKAMNICEDAFLRIQDPKLPSWTFVVISVFGIRDIEYNDDKCQMTIKPRYYDPASIDMIMDKDLNIINTKFPVHTITYNEDYQFEFKTAYSYMNQLSLDLGGECFEENFSVDIPYTNATFQTYGEPWTFFSQTNTALVDLDSCGFPYYDIVTTWFREVKFIPLAIDPDKDANIPIGTSTKQWFWIESVELENGIYYNKYAREVDNLVFWRNTTSNPKQWQVTDYYGKNKIRTLTRARKLIDILDYYKTQFNCNTLQSDFFKNNVNPISGNDLTNLMIMQKSDAKFEEGLERTDPARLGIITFRKLMQQLWAMFQVQWTIIGDVLHIEHISYFKWNFSYTPNTTVGIDLTAYYPLALTASNSYSWETKLPIREKFTFMEAWNIDFVGTDIEYTNCLKEGNTETYSADMITTDLDPTYLDNEASNDGFVLFHCNADNEVISEEGMISGITSANVHLSWANLHNYYWRAYRPLPGGIMNGIKQAFGYPKRKLKKQVPIEFPFCSQNVDDLIYDYVRTTMGDGEIGHAEYSLKTGNIKIELSYGST